jgi:transposase
MPACGRELPRTVEELTDLLRSLDEHYERQLAEREQQLEAQAQQVREQALEILSLSETLELLRRKLFGRLSEKSDPEDERQGKLFNEAEATVDAEAEEETEAKTTVAVASHKRKKTGGRKPVDAKFPRERVVHDIPEEEKVCGCGEPLTCIGEQPRLEVEIIPAQVKVVEHVQLKYACRSCEGSDRAEGAPAVKTASAPAKLIPRSITTPSLLAVIATGKFVDGLPFSRQEKQFQRLGINISRQDMSNWMIACGRACEPLNALMEEDLRAGPMVGVDETPVQVLGEPGRKNTSTSRMWVFRGGAAGKPLVLYRYHPTRASDVPLLYLRGYLGYLQTDDYSGYDAIAREPGVTHVGCWAHARRKFVEAQKVGHNSGSAHVAIAAIAKLYKTEKELREELADGALTLDQFSRRRRRAVVPTLRSLRDWYREKLPLVPPKTLLGKAIFYLDHEWPKLLRYLYSAHLTPDNNAVERAVRPFVVGRKSWLFAGCPSGAYASATLYSLVESAKASGIDPHSYFRFLFAALPHAKTRDELRDLLPYNLTPERLAASL